MKIFRGFLMIVAGFVFSNQAVFAANYAVDADHTSVSFKVRHILTNVQGQFKKFDGSFVYDPKKSELWSVKGAIQTASIDTNVAERDKHLRSADFFDVEKYPTISFVSTKAKDVTPTQAKLEGLLTIHGVQKPVVLDVDILGVVKDPWGNVSASFTATTKINRKDFGLIWNQVLETGQLLVGEEVWITLEVSGLEKE